MIETTQYYDEFLDYFKLASDQQAKCNLGSEPHAGSVADDLMCNVCLYDVVERAYAGFSQIVHDMFYGHSDRHPYAESIKNGTCSEPRQRVVDLYGDGAPWSLEESLYALLVHRLTGSAINYAKNPSGYHNTILPAFHNCKTIEDMVNVVKTYDHGPFYTSVGYQFPRFPKPPAGYKRGGDYFLCEYLPKLTVDVCEFLATRAAANSPPTFRELGDMMFKWNTDRGLVKYKFQYAAFIADVADWFPHLIQRDSLFYYGTNALECISYLAKPTQRMSREKFSDVVMYQILEDTGSLPYNAEDVACDFIRWIENYCKPGPDYAHLDLDQVWNSSNILNHPKGRQKAMLTLGLVDTFNGMANHPSDFTVLEQSNTTPQEYQDLVANL